MFFLTNLAAVFAAYDGTALRAHLTALNLTGISG